MQTIIPPKMEPLKSNYTSNDKLNKSRAALAMGGLLALFHAGWSALVAFRVAQKAIDFVLWLHFLSVPVIVGPFSLGRATGLVVFTFVVGYVLGYIFAAAWNGYKR